jgi:hypothetical protein
MHNVEVQNLQKMLCAFSILLYFCYLFKQESELGLFEVEVKVHPSSTIIMSKANHMLGDRPLYVHFYKLSSACY